MAGETERVLPSDGVSEDLFPHLWDDTMPRIRFTADPKLPRDWADKPYRKDYEADVSADEANRWVRRGVAVMVDAPDAPDVPEDAPPVVDVAPPPPEIPDDWRDQHHMARIALARRLTDEPVETAADADEIIAAEVERRIDEHTIDHIQV